MITVFNANSTNPSWNARVVAALNKAIELGWIKYIGADNQARPMFEITEKGHEHLRNKKRTDLK